MMRNAAHWFGAVAASAVLHLGLALIVVAVFAPRPVRQQPAPAANLALTTLTVPQNTATEAMPRSDRTEPGTISSDGIGTRPIPRSQAVPARPSVETAAALQPDGTQAIPQLARPSALKPASTEAPRIPDARLSIIPARAAAAEPTAASQPVFVPTSLAAIRIPGPRPLPDRDIATIEDRTIALLVNPEVAPDRTTETTEPVSERKPRLAPLDASVPPAARLATSDAGAVSARPADLPSDAATDRAAAKAQLTVEQELSPTTLAAFAPPTSRLAAAVVSAASAKETDFPTDSAPGVLAWSGDLSLLVGQETLETAAALRLPSPAASGLRDALADRLAQVDCARVQTVYNPETGAIDLRGHVKSDADRARLMASISRQLGGALPLNDSLQRLGAPQCTALVRLAEMPLPQSVEQLTNPLIIGADLQTRSYRFADGQTMRFDLSGADYDGWLYLDYFDNEGQVLHLIPNKYIAPLVLPAKATLGFGDGSSQDPALGRFEMRVSPPFGQDIAVAMVANEPLFEAPRPTVEAAAPYLDALAARVEALRKNPHFKGEWVYLFVETLAAN